MQESLDNKKINFEILEMKVRVQCPYCQRREIHKVALGSKILQCFFCGLHFSVNSLKDFWKGH